MIETVSNSSPPKTSSPLNTADTSLIESFLPIPHHTTSGSPSWPARIKEDSKLTDDTWLEWLTTAVRSSTAQGMRRELAVHGIQVTVLLPQSFKTRMQEVSGPHMDIATPTWCMMPDAWRRLQPKVTRAATSMQITPGSLRFGQQQSNEQNRPTSVLAATIEADDADRALNFVTCEGRAPAYRYLFP